MRTRLLWCTLIACSPCFVAGCGASRTDRVASAPLAVDIVPAATGIEGAAHGFPALRTRDGERLADGEFTQWLEGDRLHVRIRYEFGPARSIEELSVIQQSPVLVQERWSWVEMRDGRMHRRFEVDFLAGNATAEKLDGNDLRRWSEHVDVEPGHAFAGSAWALVIKGVRERLVRGETIEFQTVGFTPQPRAATVQVSHVGLDRVPMSGRTIEGDRFRIHAKIPWVVKLFVDVPDSQLWLVGRPPPAFLRFEGPLAEPDDPIVRVDLLPGEPSEPAAPATR